MDLAIVTFTHNDRSVLLNRCVNSLCEFKRYQVIKYLNSPDEFSKERIASLKLAKYVCFVDDDDEVCNNSIEHVYEAMKRHDVGVAFTDELLVDSSGKELRRRSGDRFYEQINTKPYRVHHLSMINTEYLNGVNMDHLLGHVNGVDWWIRSKAISIAAAIHIPIIGYKWYQYEKSLGNTSPVNALPLNMEMPFKGKIEQYGVNLC